MSATEEGAAPRSLGFALGPTTVAFVVDGPRSAALARRLFASDEEANSEAGDVRLSLRDVEPSSFEGGDVEGRYRLATAAEATGWLMGHTSRRLAERCEDGLLLHAAATRLDDRALVWPGESGAGKSSLSAFLRRRGHGWLSDEAVLVEPDGRVSGLPRALHLKRGGVDAAREAGLLSASEIDAGWPFEGGVLLRPPEDRAPATVGGWIFPRFVPGATSSLEALSPARAAHRLLQAAINVHRFEDRGLSIASSLVRRGPCFALEHGGFHTLEDALGRLEDALRGVESGR